MMEGIRNDLEKETRDSNVLTITISERVRLRFPRTIIQKSN